MESLKLFGAAGVLTVLIWAAADSLVNETVFVAVSFRLNPAASKGDVLVSILPNQGPFQLQLSGPRKWTTRLQEIKPLSITLTVPDLPSGTSSIPLKEQLREQWREYPKIFVSSVVPPQINVLVDRMVAQELTVTATQLTLPYDVKPQVQPSWVSIRMRESHVRQAFPGGQLPPMDVSAAAEKLLADQPVGQNVVVRVPLDALAYGPDAALSPSAVDVRCTITAARSTAEIPTVPILLAVSFNNLGRPVRAVGRNQGELVTQTIKVTGPAEDVARLLRGETRAYGVIHLKDEHLAELDVFKPFTPDFQLPLGVELATKPRPIELKLVDAAKPTKDEAQVPPP